MPNIAIAEPPGSSVTPAFSVLVMPETLDFESETRLLNPLTEVTVILADPDVPATKLSVLGDVDIEKLGDTVLYSVKASILPWPKVLLGTVPVGQEGDV